MRYREIARKLRKLGCTELPRSGGGSHRKWVNPATNALTIIPDWGNKDLKLGTLRSIVRQLQLGWDEFSDS